MARIDDQELLTLALKSEVTYFALAAQRYSQTGSDLYCVPNFSELLGANVCFLDPNQRTHESLTKWLLDLETQFIRLGAHWARFYGHQPCAELESHLAESGYRHRFELIHAHDLTTNLGCTHAGGDWVYIEPNAGWSKKLAVLGSSLRSSDGHIGDPLRLTILEQVKALAGGIKFLVYSVRGQPVATIGLMHLDQTVVRLKNYFVHPNFRNEGIGKQALTRLFQGELVNHYRIAVNLSVKHSVGERLYRSLGARDLGFVREWTKRL